MNIRGHHLFCIFGYRGFGYNSRFSKNIAIVIDYLKSNQNDEFTVVTDCDAICESCPHLSYKKCSKNGSQTHLNMKFHDLRTLKALNIKPEIRLSFALLKEKIKKAEIDLDEICVGCEWLNLGFCKDGLKLIKNSKMLKNH